MSAPQWQAITSINDPNLKANFKQNIIPPDVFSLIDTISKNIPDLITNLQTVETVLKNVKKFIINDINPLLTALIFILDQILTFINNIRESNIYALTIIPNVTELDAQSMQDQFVHFKDLFPTQKLDPRLAAATGAVLSVAGFDTSVKILKLTGTSGDNAVRLDWVNPVKVTKNIGVVIKRTDEDQNFKALKNDSTEFGDFPISSPNEGDGYTIYNGPAITAFVDRGSLPNRIPAPINGKNYRYSAFIKYNVNFGTTLYSKPEVVEVQPQVGNKAIKPVSSISKISKKDFKNTGGRYGDGDDHGFYLLSPTKAFQLYSASFDDLGDANRPPAGKQKTQLLLASGTTNNANYIGTYFLVDGQGDAFARSYYFWYSDGTIADPKRPGRIGKEITIQPGYTPSQVVAATVSALSSTGELKVSTDGQRVIVVYSIKGNRSYIFNFQSNPTNRSPITFSIVSEGDSVYAGGIVLVAAGGKGLRQSGPAVIQLFNIFANLYDALGILFDPESFKRAKQDMLDKITIANYFASGITTIPAGDTARDFNSIKPDWVSMKVVRDYLLDGAIGNLLNSIDSVVRGFRTSLGAAQTSLAQLINYIDSKIQELNALIATVQAFQQQLARIRALLQSLNNVEFKVMFVPPQTGGINILRSSLLTSPGGPDPALEFTCLISFVGSGIGFSLLANIIDSTLLGGRNGFKFDINTLGIDPALTSKDPEKALKTKFNIKDFDISKYT